MGARRLRATLTILGALFAVTGCVGLLAEQVFEKLLGLLVGTSTPAGAVVLAVYFAGLTSGAAAYAVHVKTRVANPFRAYAVLEGGVALWGLLLAVVFDRIIPVFAPLVALGFGRPWLLQLLRGVSAVTWIFPPTFLMGATFPAVVDALEALRVPGRGRIMARFYGLNLLGGLAGALAGPYFLFPFLGADGTLLLSAALDAAVAVVALRLARQLRLRAAVEARSSVSVPVPTPSRATGLLLLAAGLSGFLFFALEVLWTHLIGAVLGNSVFAFAAMLAAVLLSLFLGGWLVSVLFPSRSRLPAWAPAALLVIGAFLLLFSHELWPRVPHSLATFGAGISGFYQGELLRLGHAIVLLVPPATVLGMVFPSLFRLELFPAADWAATTGRMTSVNCVGCIAGALVSGFLLLPRLGSEASHLVLAALCGFGALGLSLALARGRSLLFSAGAAALVLLLSGSRPPWDRLALTSGEHVYFRRGHVLPDFRLRLFHEDASGGITTVVERPPGPSGRGARILLTNGKFQGNDSGEGEAQVGVALAPILQVPRFGDALVIGLGTGHSAFIVVGMGFHNVDVAEIAPGIVEAARTEFAHLNRGVLAAPPTRVFLEDGRNLLLLRERRYDLISMEISSVWFAGSTNLYSREFYELARSRLKPDGMFQQWIQLHHIGTAELVSAIATLRSVFPEVSVWTIGGQGVLIASVVPQRLQPGAVAALQERARYLGWPPAEVEGRYARLLASRLLAPGDVTRLLNVVHSRLNTDRNRFFEYATPRYNLSPLPWERINLLRLAAFAAPPAFEMAPGVAGVLGDVHRAVGAEARRAVLELP